MMFDGLQSRKDAAEAAKPTIIPKEQAQAIDEQSKATKFSQEQAKAINDVAIERYKPHDPENVNKNTVENPEESGIIESKEKQAIKRAFLTGTTSDEIVGEIIDNHKGLGEFTPEEMKTFLEDSGHITNPLGGKSTLKGIPFEEGGGYRTSFLAMDILCITPKKIAITMVLIGVHRLV